MTTPKVMLGGTVLGGDSTYMWPLTDGSAPAEGFWTVTKERADSIPKGVPLEFVVASDRKTLKVSEIYCLEVLPARSPKQRVLRLADRRWKWSRGWIETSLNVRKTTGNTISLLGEGQALEVVQFETAIEFAKWSLYPVGEGTTRWTFDQSLAFVFSKIEGGQPYRVEGTLPETTIVDLRLVGSPATCLDQLFAYSASGMTVALDKAGVAVVRQQAKSGLKTQVPQALRKQVVGSDMTQSDRRAIRPKTVRVYFDREQEIRFDYSETGTVVRDTPVLINVAPSPDPTVVAKGKSYARGSYVGLPYLFEAWGVMVGPEVLDKNAAVAAAFGDGRYSFAGLAAVGFWLGDFEQIFANGLVFNYEKARRTRATVEHWRKTYQIDEQFMQRLSSVRATRVRVLSQITGTRAKSDVYCSFSRRPNYLNHSALAASNDEIPLAWRSQFDGGPLSEADMAAPVDLTIIDGQAGILRVEPLNDFGSLSDTTILGYATGDRTPRGGDSPGHDKGAANRTGEEALAQWGATKMDADFKLATILTASVASPNDVSRFHAIDVHASTMGEQNAEGPVLCVRVSPAIQTARFAWDDAQYDAIVGAIKQGTPPPAELLTNPGMVEEIAKASARAVYHSYVDMPLTSSGPVSIDMDPEWEPDGSITGVAHGLRDGTTVTELVSSGVRRPVDIWAFLPAVIRERLMRLG